MFEKVLRIPQVITKYNSQELFNIIQMTSI